MSHKSTSITAAPATIANLDLAYQAVEFWAQTTPLAPALSDATRAINYATLATAIEEIANLLRERGVLAGDRVLIVSENNIAAVAALFASQRLGAWPAVVNARLPAQELDGLRTLVEPRLLVFAVADSVACAEHASNAGASLIGGLLAGPLALSSSDAKAHTEAEPEQAEDRVGLLIFTSGTTGRPKAVMHAHRGLLALGSILSRSRRVSSTDCYNGVAPLAHIMGIANLMSVIAVGASLRLMPRLELPQLAAAVAAGDLSHLSFVPTVYARLLDYIEANDIDVSGHRLRYISCGGAPLDGTLQQRVQSLFGIPLINGYGMTECAPGTRTPADRYSETGSVGFAEEGVEIRIVAPDGRDVEDGGIGEVWMRAPAAMLGYYRNPVDTAATVRSGGWIATGDLGQRLADGALAVVGRQKEMIIRSGFNVYPAEVEAALNSLPGIAASGVVGRPLGGGDEEIVAFVETRPGYTLDTAEVDAALRTLIAPYKRPSRIIPLSQLPQGSTGKIWKAKLTMMAAEPGDSTQMPKPPSAPQYVAPPEWLLRAISAPSQSHFLQCPDVRLHYRSWNAEDTNKPVLLFAHGYRANSHWWDFIAPFFVDRYRVFAMDFAGMGGSGPRSLYTAETFAEDLTSILDSDLGPATVIGHSYGGLRTLRACADRPDLIRHAIILDSRVRFLDVDNAPDVVPSSPRSGSVQPHPSYEAIRKRYRVLPEQPLPLYDTFEHVAFHSIEECDGGWRWRADPALPYTLVEPDGDALLKCIEIPVDYVYGEESSVVEPWRAERIAAGLRQCSGAIGIPQSYHHLMLDQPLTLVAVLRTLLVNRSA